MLAQQLDGLFHILHGGGHQRGKSAQLDVPLFHRVDYRLRRHVLAQIYHIVAIIFQHGFDYVFADVVHVAEHGGKHYVALSHRAAFDMRLDFFKAQLCRLRRGNQLREEYHALFIVVAHAIERGNKQFVYHLQRLHYVKLFARDVRRLRQPFGDIVIYILPLFRGRGGRFGFGCSVPFHPARAAFVRAGEHIEGVHSRHHFGDIGVDYGQIQSRLHRHCEKSGIYRASGGKSERYVGNAQNRAHSVFALNAPQRFQRVERLPLFRAHRKRKTVYIYILFGYAESLGALYYPARVFQPPFHSGRNAPFVHGKSHHRRAVLGDYGQNAVKARLFRIHGIDYGFAVHRAQSRLYGVGLAAVYLERQFHRRLYALDHLAQNGFFVYARHARVYVQNVRARFRLLYRARRHISHIAL